MECFVLRGVPSTRRLRRGARRQTLGVSVRASLHALGRILEIVSLALAVPALVAAIYLESPLPFLVPLAIGLAVGFVLERSNRGSGRLGTREAFLVATLTWVAAAILGSVPYLLAKNGLGHWTDAFMESMAGLTTSNISVLKDPSALPRSLLFWRQFSQWLGGLGVIVLVLALLPRLRVGGRELMAPEQPGREVEQLSRGVQAVIRRFGALYVALTAAAALTLIGLDLFDVDDRLNVFDSIGIAFSTVSTGGFSPRAGSLAAYSTSTQWVVFGFMLLAGANILLVFRALVRRELRPLLRDGETRVYLAIGVLGAIGIAAALAAGNAANGWGSVREGFFQSVSFLTTTGFTDANIAAWPLAAPAILVGLVLIGGCASSLAGSQKIMRVQIIGKLLHRELVQTVHPETIRHIRRNRRLIDERAVRGVTAFVLIFFGLLALGTLTLELDAARMNFHLDIFSAIADAAAALANGGPGLGFAGPIGSFAPFSDVSKLVLSALMLLGRLEIIPVAVLFTKSYWRA
jgi:trk system potassium uptake protein TrkH